MHEQTHEVVSPCVESEQHPDSYIVNASLHGPVHGFSVPCIVAFRSCRMEDFVILSVVSLLEQDVCAYPGFLQLPVVLDCSCRNIHIYPPDCPVPVVGAVYRLD